MNRIVSKKKEPIHSVDQWFELAPPKEGQKHWVNGRSAKETARLWMAPSMPDEVRTVIEQHPDFAAITDWHATPEYESKFDAFRGPANIDLMLWAEDEFGKFIVGIESKADEPFSTTLEKTHQQAQKALIKSPNSKRVERLNYLVVRFLGKTFEELTDEKELRYQLFTGLAGTIAEAEVKKTKRAVFLIHEFVTNETTDKKHQLNQQDLNAFVSALTKGKETELKAGSMIGPLNLPTSESGHGTRVYLAKVMTDLR